MAYAFLQVMSRYGRSRCASPYYSHGSASSVGTLCAERLAAADIYEPVRRRFPLTLLRSHFLRTARVPSVVHRLTDRSFASPSILVLFRSSLSLHTNSPPPSAWGLHPGGFFVRLPLGAHYPSLLRPVVVVVTHLPALGLVLRASSAVPPLLYPPPAPAPSAAAYARMPGYTVIAITPASASPGEYVPPVVSRFPVSFVPDRPLSIAPRPPPALLLRAPLGPAPASPMAPRRSPPPRLATAVTSALTARTPPCLPPCTSALAPPFGHFSTSHHRPPMMPR